jgi:hypothetical protein
MVRLVSAEAEHFRSRARLLAGTLAGTLARSCPVKPFLLAILFPVVAVFELDPRLRRLTDECKQNHSCVSLCAGETCFRLGGLEGDLTWCASVLARSPRSCLCLAT